MAKSNKWVNKILDDFKRAREAKKDWVEVAKEDYEFALGKQWDDNDVETLRKIGVHALTINKIQPNLFLVSGLQRQNRTDFKAFPIGEEDSIPSEITTMLLKNVMVRANGDLKVSEQFEDGAICGEGWLEVYLDYSESFLQGELKLKKIIPFNIFKDPESTEYDLSDAEFLIKFTPNLSIGQVKKLFPDKEKEISKIGEGKLDIAVTGQSAHIQKEDSPHMDDSRISSSNEDNPAIRAEKVYDLTEYYYREYVPKYYVLDKKLGTVKETDDEEEAQRYVDTTNQLNGEVVAAIVKRMVAEIRCTALVGSVEVDDYVCPLYPRWRSFPFVPYYAHRITTPIDKKELMVQGIVRSLKDPQRELNKRRTQELRHINQSANSGWLVEKGAWVDKDKVEKFGSSPGINLEYNKGYQKPEKIIPTPISAGHHLLAEQSAEDMKDISGINADLLAMEDKTASGRAIMLRQQQGMVMIQRILDNLTMSKKLLAKIILSQLGEVYTVDTAAKVIGDAFIRENFSVPVMTQSQVDGAPVPVMEGGQMKMQVDPKAVGVMLNKILNDADLSKYDVSVGESINTETVRYANFLTIMEMAEKGVPIPPEVLINESLLPQGTKQQIKQVIAAAQQQAATAPRQEPGKEPPR